MKQLPDDTFRRRLKDHSLPPPPSAWSRVESNLPGNRRNTWIKVAAALLLLLTASALIVLVRSNSNPQPVAEEQSLPKANPPRPTDSTMDGKGTNENNTMPTEKTPGAEEAPPARPDSPTNRHTAAKEALPSDHNDKHVAEATKAATDDTVTAEPAPDVKATPSILTATVPTGGSSPFKLVLEAGEVQAKYLRKKSVAHATEEDSRSSGLKKLLDKANGISNQDPIGDLRQMKNDIFALNFQGKKRDQNK